MNKEEAKVRIDSIINHLEWRHGGGTDYVESDRDQAHQIIDQIEPDHPKVKLPREVGEDFDKAVAYLKNKYNSEDVFDVLATNLSKQKGGDYHSRLNAWYVCSDDALPILIDAYRYGWEAEPEAKWYVKAPKEWWEKPDIPEWMYLYNKRGVCSGFKLSRTAFTRAEINNYHFDSDIFTLVPVEDEK